MQHLKPTYEDLEKTLKSQEKEILALRLREKNQPETERTLHTLMNNLPGVVYRCVNNQNWSMQFLSDGCFALTGYRSEQLINDKELSYSQLMKPEFKETVWNEVQSALLKREQFQLQYPIITAGGEEKWVSERGIGIYDDMGRVVALEGFIEDISDHKVAAQSLKETVERLQLALDATEDGLWEKDFAKGGNFFSPRMFTMLGYEPAEQLQCFEFFASLLHPDDRERALSEYYGLVHEMNKNDYSSEFRLKASDGAWRHILSRGKCVERGVDGKALRIIGTHTDISELKEAEKSLVENEERLKLAVEASKGGVWEIRIKPNIDISELGDDVYLSPELKNLIGYEDHEIPNSVKSWTSRIVPEDLEKIWKTGQDCVAGKTEVYETEYQIRHKDGTLRWMATRGKVSRPEGDALLRLTGIVRDITEEKKAQRQILESKEKYRQLFELESDAVFLIEKSAGQILEVNAAATRLYGYSKEELLQMKNTDLSAEPEKTTNATVTEKTQIPVRYHRKRDGTIFPVEITASHLRWSGKDVHIAAIRDITFRMQAEEERYLLEKKLSQAQKMEAIGTLAGGIAHDFNNILGIIMGYTELSLRDLSENDLLHSRLSKVMEASQRAKDLVGQILTYSRRTEPQLNPVAISPLMQDVIKLLRASLPSTIEIIYKIETNQDTVLGDPTQIKQILINLCTNAADAMFQAGGVLELKADKVETDNERMGPDSQLDTGTYLMLSVADNGHGIEEENLERIFDPYFTTKQKGKGTGLGLSVALGIVKSHGGHIAVDSKPGVGTVFRVYLPLIDVKPLDVIKQEPVLIDGTGHLLVVDDEAAIVDFQRQALQQIGYRVTATTKADEALQAFRSEPSRYDAVITDMTMPNMTGDKLSIELKKIRPDIPIILCTGFSERISEEQALSMGIDRFLLKPVSLAQLANTLGEVLGL